MLAHPALAPEATSSDDRSWLESRLSAGAAITVKAAERHAARTGASVVAPSHLLVALLERPQRQVRAYIQDKGGALTWLCDMALAGIGHFTTLRGPGLDTIVEAAHDEARASGKEHADDFCLFLAVLKHGDVLSDRLLREAGLITAPAVAMTEPNTPSQLNALVATPSPFRPRLDAPISSAPVRQAPWRRNTRALLKAIDLSPLFLLLVCIVVVCGALLAGDPSEGLVRPLTIGFIVSVWLVSLSLHEFGHAAAAFLAGDRSVKKRGYLTLDLRRYADPLLTIGLPLLFLLAGGIPLPGGAVWIDHSAIRSPRANRLVSAAGPAANLCCLLLLSVPLALGVDQWSPLGSAVAAAAMVQASAIVLNLLPVPPLDGWHIASAGSSPAVRAQAAAFGWGPVFALMILLRASPQINAVYWGFVDLLGAIFSIEWEPALSGLRMLQLG